MLKRNNKSLFINIFVLISLLCIGISAFAENFSNNLLKTDLTKSSVDGINLNLSTSKPYQDKITVNKKNDTEYVILMPETSNSIVTKPSTRGVSDVITNVDVKTQQFQGNIKGYTKITIKTTKPVTINPKVQVVNIQNRLTDKDYNELLSNAKAAKKITSVPKDNKNKKIVSSKNTTQVIIGKNRTTVATTKHNITKTNTAKNSISSKKVIANASKTTVQKKSVKTQPVQKSKAIVHEKINNENISTESITQSQTVNTDTNIQKSSSQNMTNPQSEKEFNSELQQADNTLVANTTATEQLSWKQLALKYIKILRNHIPIVFMLVAFIFISMLLMARNMSKSIQNAKETFTSNLKEVEKTAVDYTEKIDDGMDWQEKFQTYVETKDAENIPPNSQKLNDSNSEIDGLFDNSITNNEVNIQETNIPETVEFSQEGTLSNDITEPEIAANSTINQDEYQEDNFYNSEVSAEDLFNEEELETSSTINLNDYKENDLYNSEISAEDLFADDENNNDTSSEIFEEEIINISEEPIEIENEKSTTAIEESEDLVKSEYIIDENKGFYLVDFEDSTALVGHIDDDVFVLKRFSDIVNAPLKARINEKEKNSTRYMTRVGNFRGVVEVTPDKMNLLVEL